MKCTRLVCLLGVAVLLIAAGRATATPVSENFDTFVKTSWETPIDTTWHGFHFHYVVCDTMKAYGGGSHRSPRLRNGTYTPSPYMEYVGDDSMGHDGGTGTVSFLWRNWSNTSAAIEYKAYVQINGGTYDSIGVFTATDSLWHSFSYAVNTSQNNVRIKILKTLASGERLIVDEFQITDYAGGDVTPPSISSLTVVNLTHLDVLFTEPVEQTTAQTLTNYWVMPGTVNPSAATRDGGNLALVHLTFASNLPAGTDTLFVNAVQDTSSNHNACSNISRTFVITGPDYTPPDISLLSVVSKTALDVLFDEPVEQTTAQTVGNYTVAPGGIHPSAAVRDGSNIALVHLTFAANLPTGHDTLTVNAVQDTSSNHNACSNLVRYFSIPLANTGDIVINEIMYDDTGSTDIEWVEVHNRTASAIDISGWALVDAPEYPVGAVEGGIQVPASTPSIPASGYLVLCKEDLPDITGEVICTQYHGSWALSNTGDNLGLYSDTAAGLRIDGYATSNTTLFYPDWAPSNAGYSIEKCDENTTWTGDSSAWHASTHNYGTGRYVKCTPGATNSVCVPDTVRPTLVSIAVANNITLDVVFSEALYGPTAETAANYSVNNGIGNPSTATLQGDLVTVRLAFRGPMAVGNYILTVDNVQDLAFNPILPGSQIGFTVNPLPYNIKYTEFMPNPNFASLDDSLGEWFEIYNGGDHTVNMSGWIIADNAGRDTLEGTVNIGSGHYFVFCSKGDSAVNGGVPTDYAYHYGTSGWGLSLSNTADSLTLRDLPGNVVATQKYTTAFHWAAGQSAQLRDLSYDGSMDTSWCIAETTWVGAWNGDHGTPRAATICAAAYIPDTVTICAIRVQDTCGVPTRYHTRVVSRGVITYVDTCKATGYLQSNGCAVAIYGGTLYNNMVGASRIPAMGDSIMIDGYITQFRGLTEFATYSAFVPVITYLGAGATVNPVTITCADIGEHADSCRGETYESRIVQLQNVTFINPSGNFPLADSNYAILCGSDTAFFRLDSCDLALIGTAIPTTPVNITGVLGQFDSTVCYCGGYQLLYAGRTAFQLAQCAQPESLTVIRDGSNDAVILRWKPGHNQWCNCYEIWYTTDAAAIFPTSYTYLAYVVGSTSYTDALGTATRRIYRVIAGGSHCP
jgi:hypothetical protein